MFINITGTRSSTFIDHIFNYTVELCSKAVSVPIGCSDHNIMPTSRKAKALKAGPQIVYKRSSTDLASYVDDLVPVIFINTWYIDL